MPRFARALGGGRHALDHGRVDGHLMEPFRAFVGDSLPASQRVTGFAMQSFFIGTGAVVASIRPGL